MAWWEVLGVLRVCVVGWHCIFSRCGVCRDRRELNEVATRFSCPSPTCSLMYIHVNSWIYVANLLLVTLSEISEIIDCGCDQKLDCIGQMLA